jgi:hypothetical protein
MIATSPADTSATTVSASMSPYPTESPTKSPSATAPNRRMLRIGSTSDPAAGLSCCYDFPHWIKAGPAGGRLRRPSSAGSGTAGRGPGRRIRRCYFTVTVMQSLTSTWVPSVLITRKTMSN